MFGAAKAVVAIGYLADDIGGAGGERMAAAPAADEIKRRRSRRVVVEAAAAERDRGIAVDGHTGCACRIEGKHTAVSTRQRYRSCRYRRGRCEKETREHQRLGLLDGDLDGRTVACVAALGGRAVHRNG